MAAELPEYDSLRGISLQTFAASALFERTFDEGMELVEECARYLDGRGRNESRALPRRLALVYAGESMRVTTRLMQAASWLLIQRAVHEGDMTVEDASSERYRLGAREICLGKREDGIEFLPKKLVELLERSDSLYRRVARLDEVLFRKDPRAEGVKSHFALLEAAFGPAEGDEQRPTPRSASNGPG
jgi:regulator of CtrA degradation